MATSFPQLAEVNPLRYRGYVYDQESNLYYLQSRYYDPSIGRFLNADSYASTGQGILGNNMFAYCGNNPVSFIDSTGFSYQHIAASIRADTGLGPGDDYIIYYLHPDSSVNLDDPALQNHVVPESNYVAVSSFDELASALNNLPKNVDDVFIYVHGDENNLSFYYAQYYSADDITASINNVNIGGDIYLFSCRAGRGELASAMASATNCTVIACVYKVSFDADGSRCGWVDYFGGYFQYGSYAWYSYSPSGETEPYGYHWVCTQ